jgi:hypothetical protein
MGGGKAGRACFCLLDFALLDLEMIVLLLFTLFTSAVLAYDFFVQLDCFAKKAEIKFAPA